MLYFKKTGLSIRSVQGGSDKTTDRAGDEIIE